MRYILNDGKIAEIKMGIIIIYLFFININIFTDNYEMSFLPISLACPFLSMPLIRRLKCDYISKIFFIYLHFAHINFGSIFYFNHKNLIKV